MLCGQPSKATVLIPSSLRSARPAQFCAELPSGPRVLLRRIAFWLLLAFGLSFLCATSLPAQDGKPNTPEPNATRLPAGSAYTPISTRQRAEWFFLETVGPESLQVGLFTAGIGTARDKPPEYGPHWEGFVKRYGMRFTGIATSNLMEVGLGGLIGEDPRYPRMGPAPFKKRFGNIFVMAVAAKRRSGRLSPAYARFAAIPASNFLSNTWRADGEAHASDAAIRTGYGFLARVAANAWEEFWPSVKPHVFHSH